MTQFCEKCELLEVCERAFATHVSPDAVKVAETRLTLQNYIVDLGMSANKIIDWIIDKVDGFHGRYTDEQGHIVPTPSYLPILNPGARYWFRDQLEGGRWNSVEQVPHWRSEAIGRWRLIAVARDIAETVQPICL
jgi:hypothetical protein